MYEVKAETSGTLQEILVEEGDVVEYEQPLFMIAPNS
ncbi:MAG: biotin/lipoyl-containing protein [Psychrobacter alimentarius]